MKKIIALLLAMVLMLGITACGTSESETAEEPVKEEGKVIEAESKKDTTETTEESTTVADVVSVEDFMTWIEDKIDVSKYNVSDPTDKLVTYTAENKEEIDLDGVISLGDGTSIDMPMAISRLVAQGWSTIPDSEMDVELKPGYSTGALLKKGDVKLTVHSANLSDKTATYGDGHINRILFGLYSSEDKYGERLSSAPDFEICGEINNTSDIDEVISTLGMPKSISYSIIGDNAYADIELDYYGGSAYDNLEIKFNADGSKIVSIDYGCDVR